MPDFSAEQNRISDVEKKAGTTEKETGKKTHEQLEAELKARHEVFFAKVNATQTVFQQAEKLKDPDAKASMEKDKTEINDKLGQAAASGEILLTSKENNFSTIRQSSDRISKVSAEVKGNLGVFQDIDKATDMFEKEVKPQLAEIKRLVDKGADANNDADKKLYEQTLTFALQSLGEDGVLGVLSKYQGSLPNADIQKVYDKIKNPVDAALNDVTNYHRIYNELFKYDTDEKKEKMNPEIKKLLAIDDTHGLIEISRVQMANGTDDDLEGAKVNYQDIIQKAPAVERALTDIDESKLSPDYKTILFVKKTNLPLDVKEAQDQLKKIQKGHEKPIDADAVLSEVSKAYNEGEDSAVNNLKKTFVLRDKILAKAPPDFGDKDLRDSTDKTLTSLCPLKGKLLRIDRLKLSTEQQAKFDATSHAIDSNIAEVSQILTMSKNQDLVAGFDKMDKHYFKIVKKIVNGVEVVAVEQTDEFKNLSEKDKKEYLIQFAGVQASVTLELTQKLDLEEDKEWNAAFGKFESDDWQGAKQGMLNYYNKFQGNPDKVIQLGSARGILQGIMNREFAQCKEHVYMMKDATHSRYFSVEGIDLQAARAGDEVILSKLDAAEKEMASGRYVTIEDLWAVVGKPEVPEADRRIVINGINFTDPSIVEGLLSEPDTVKRKANILSIAKAAESAGLTEFAKKYYAMYFDKEITAKRKVITREAAAQEFNSIPDKDGRVEEGIRRSHDSAKDRFMEDYRRQHSVPVTDEILNQWEANYDTKKGDIKTTIENALVDELWSKMAKQAVDSDMSFNVHTSDPQGLEIHDAEFDQLKGGAGVNTGDAEIWRGAYQSMFGKVDSDVGGGFTSEELVNSTASIGAGIIYAQCGVMAGAVGGLGATAIIGATLAASTGMLTVGQVGLLAAPGAFVGNTIGQTVGNYLLDPDQAQALTLKGFGKDLAVNGLLNLIFEGSGKVFEVGGEALKKGMATKGFGEASAKEGYRLVTPFGEQTINTGLKIGKSMVDLTAKSSFNAGLMTALTGGDFGEHFITFMVMGVAHEFAPSESEIKVKQTKEGETSTAARSDAISADKIAEKARKEATAAKESGSPQAEALEQKARELEAKAKTLKVSESDKQIFISKMSESTAKIKGLLESDYFEFSRLDKEIEKQKKNALSELESALDRPAKAEEKAELFQKIDEVKMAKQTEIEEKLGKKREEIEKELKGAEYERQQLLEDIFLKLNPDIKVVDREKGIYKIEGKDPQGNDVSIYGSLFSIVDTSKSINDIREIAALAGATSVVGCESSLVLSGSSAQREANPYPTDIDLAEHLVVSGAKNRGDLGKIVAENLKKNLTKAKEGGLEFTEMKLGELPDGVEPKMVDDGHGGLKNANKKGGSIKWSEGEIIAGKKEVKLSDKADLEKLKSEGYGIKTDENGNNFVVIDLSRAAENPGMFKIDWRGFDQSGMLTEITKVVYVEAPNVKDFMGTTLYAAPLQEVHLLNPDFIASMENSRDPVKLQEYRNFLSIDALKYGTDGNLLKTTKRLYNQMKIDGRIDLIPEVDRILRSDYSKLNQIQDQLSMISSALREGTALDKGKIIDQLQATSDLLKKLNISDVVKQKAQSDISYISENLVKIEIDSNGKLQSKEVADMISNRGKDGLANYLSAESQRGINKMFKESPELILYLVEVNQVNKEGLGKLFETFDQETLEIVSKEYPGLVKECLPFDILEKNGVPKRITLEANIDGSLGLTAIQAELASKIPGIKLESPDKFHVTLGHLGPPNELFEQLHKSNPDLTREYFDAQFQGLLRDSAQCLPQKISVLTGTVQQFNGGAIVLTLDPVVFAESNRLIYDRAMKFLSTVGVQDPVAYAKTNPNLEFLAPDKFVPHITLGKVDSSSKVPLESLTGYGQPINVESSPSYVANSKKKSFNK